MDCAGLPCTLRHYGAEVHTLRRAGLGGAPTETVEGVPGRVGETGRKADIPEGRGELAGGKEDPKRGALVNKRSMPLLTRSARGAAKAASEATPWSQARAPRGR